MAGTGGCVDGTLLGPEGPGLPPVLRYGCPRLWGGWVGLLVVVGFLDVVGCSYTRSCCGGVWCGWWRGRLFVENFTVDASIFVFACVFQVFKGARWMPWHQEPKKDVGICDMPRGVDNQTVIRGFPNGETRLELCPVTCT